METLSLKPEQMMMLITLTLFAINALTQDKPSIKITSELAKDQSVKALSPLLLKAIFTNTNIRLPTVNWEQMLQVSSLTLIQPYVQLHNAT